MENTEKTTNSGTENLPEILKENPDVAHFVADIAEGTPLKEAVSNHFGHILQPESSAAQEEEEENADTEAPVPEPAPEPESEPAAEAEAEVGMYQSATVESGRGEPMEDACPTFLCGLRPGFWD